MTPAEFWLGFWVIWWQMANPMPRHIEIEFFPGGFRVAHCENWRRARAATEERKRA